MESLLLGTAFWEALNICTIEYSLIIELEIGERLCDQVSDELYCKHTCCVDESNDVTCSYRNGTIRGVRPRKKVENIVR